MKKIIKLPDKFLSNKLISLVLIPFLLIIFWFLSSIIFNNKLSFSVLLYNHSTNDIQKLPEGKFLKGDQIKGEFKAKDNNLGLLSLRFDQYAKHDFASEDVVLFRLREKGDKEWYYTNNYRASLLDKNLTLLIGFPLISDSKGKIYQFEIESQLGNQNNALEISRKKTAFFTGYQYSKREILKSRQKTLQFLTKKTVTSYTNFDFLLNSTLFLTPLFLYAFAYLLFYSSYSSKISLYGYDWSLGLLIVAPLDIFMIQEMYYGIFLFTLLAWVFYVLYKKLESRYTFIFSFALIFIWIGLLILHINKFQNKINVYVYLFLIIGTVQAVFEEMYFKNTIKKRDEKI